MRLKTAVAILLLALGTSILIEQLPTWLEIRRTGTARWTQQQFAHIVHKFERLRAQQREAERQAEHLFQALLHRAFRGEL